MHIRDLLTAVPRIFRTPRQDQYFRLVLNRTLRVQFIESIELTSNPCQKRKSSEYLELFN